MQKTDGMLPNARPIPAEKRVIPVLILKDPVQVPNICEKKYSGCSKFILQEHSFSDASQSSNSSESCSECESSSEFESDIIHHRIETKNQAVLAAGASK
jgi:hypothetical protein